MKEVVIISNPERRQIWENILGNAHFHLYSTYPISILLKPEEAKKIINDSKVDILLTDIRELENKKPDIKAKYLECVIELAKEIGLSNQKNLIKKRLAIFLPTKLDKQVAQMIVDAFSYNVYDFFKMHYDHGKNSVNLNEVVEQLNNEPSIVNGNQYVELARNILNGQSLSTLDNVQESGSLSQPNKEYDDSNDVISQFTQQLSGIKSDSEPKLEPKSEPEAPVLQGVNVDTEKEQMPDKLENSLNKEKVLEQKAEPNTSINEPEKPSADVSNNPVKQESQEIKDEPDKEQILKQLNKPTPSAAIQYLANKPKEKRDIRVHKHRLSNDVSRYDGPNAEREEETPNTTIENTIHPWERTFETKKSLKEKQQQQKTPSDEQTKKADVSELNKDSNKEKKIVKKKPEKKIKKGRKVSKPHKVKKINKKKNSGILMKVLIPIVILLGILFLFVCTKLSSSSTENQSSNTTTQTKKKSLNYYLKNDEFSSAIKYYPSKVAQIDNYILEDNDISDRKAAINEVYEAASSVSPILEFDHAYFNHHWRTVIKNADVADSVQREVMLSASYLAVGDVTNAQKIADRANQPALNQIIQKYIDLTNTDNQIKSQLNQSGLDNNKKQQLQDTLNNNQETINNMIDNL